MARASPRRAVPRSVAMAALQAKRAPDSAAQARAKDLAERQEERRRRQVAVLAQLDCLRGVPPLELHRLAHLCALRAFYPGTRIQGERVAGDYLYIVLRGTIRLTLHDRDGNEVLVGVLSRGDCFGEGPLFGDLFRGATVSTDTVCYLLQLPRTELSSMLEQCPALQAALRAIYRQRLIERTLGRVPLFGQLSQFERAGLAELVAPRAYARGELVIRQGAPGDALYLIESGQATVERDGRTIAYLDEGDFFGEMSLMREEPHNADIRALTPLEVLVLPAGEFVRLLEQLPLLAERVRAVVEQRLSSGASLLNDPRRSEQLALAVERGLLRGSRLLVRDPTLCEEGCRICEDACATRHGRTRISVEGVLIDGHALADVCRQCRFGAECVEACPEDALAWDSRGALVVTGSCTGCGDCVTACPYNAVELVPVGPTSHETPLWALWRRLRHLADRTIPLEPIRPPQRASKCDLCHGFDDLACVSACPTGALRLVPVEELLPL